MNSEDEIRVGGGSLDTVYDTLYLFTIFILPFLGYISSLIYSPEEGLKWYKGNKFVLLDLANSSYGLFFTLFIYLFSGMGIIYISNYYLGDGISSLMRKSNNMFDPMRNVEKFWDCIILCTLPLGFFLSWISQPLMLQYQSLVVPGTLTIISSILYFLFAIYMIKVHWIIMILFLPLCFWSIYMSVFYFLPDKGGKSSDKKSTDKKDNKTESTEDKKEDKTEDKVEEDVREP